MGNTLGSHMGFTTTIPKYQFGHCVIKVLIEGGNQGILNSARSHSFLHNCDPLITYTTPAKLGKLTASCKGSLDELH